MPSSPSRSSAPETTTTSTGRAASLPLSRSRSLGRWQHAGEVALGPSISGCGTALRPLRSPGRPARTVGSDPVSSAKAGPTRLNSAYRCPQHPKRRASRVSMSVSRTPQFQVDFRERTNSAPPSSHPLRPLHRPADHRTHFHLGHLQDVATHSAPVLSVQPIGRGLFPWPSPTAIKRRHAAHPCTTRVPQTF